MSTISARRFFKDLQLSGLLNADQFDELRRSHRKDSPLPVVQKLVARGTLTKWQARKLLQGHTQFFHGKGNKYKLLRKIGRGGMGVVYKAEQVSMGRVVALKVMSPELMQSPRNVARFLREIHITATLDHPNIIRAYDADNDDGVHFLVMEYLRGRNVREWLESSSKRVAFETACDMIQQAATGLQHVHERELVHRDVKPSNLFLTIGSDGRMIVKLLDLGLSRITSDTQEDGAVTRTGHALGTLTYMAPEQTKESREADIRSDIYALGSTFFELLTRRLPFLDANPLKMVVMKMKEDAPRVSMLRPDTPRDVDHIVARMLSRDPEKRYATPAEVVQALAVVRRKLTRRKQQLSQSQIVTPVQDESGFSDVSFISPDVSHEAISTQDTLGVPESLTIELARLCDNHHIPEALPVEDSTQDDRFDPTCIDSPSIPPFVDQSASAEESSAPTTPALVPVYQAWRANIARVDSLGNLFNFPNVSAAATSELAQITEIVPASMIVETWSAFETLAADLWEAALNANPTWAQLQGERHRVQALAGDCSSHEFATSHENSNRLTTASLAEIHELTQGTYDLRRKMGLLLKGRFHFCTLRAIREAYSTAFHPDIADVDAALASHALDELVLASSEVLQNTRTVEEQQAQALIIPAIEAAAALLQAIDLRIVSCNQSS